jgi:hypothetical protein
MNITVGSLVHSFMQASNTSEMQAAIGVGAGAWGTIVGTLANQTDLQSALDGKISGVSWGDITGTLANQTDLQSALDAKLALAGGTMTGALTVPANGGIVIGAASLTDYGSGQLGIGNHYFASSGFLAYGLLRISTGALGGGFSASLYPNAAASHILELRSGTDTQTFRVYGTETGSKYLNLTHNGTNAVISASSGNVSISSPLATTSGHIRAYVPKTTTYQITTSDDHVICNHASTPFTVTLPTLASSYGSVITIKNKGAAVVTVATNATIDGSSTATLNQNESLTVINDSILWNII